MTASRRPRHLVFLLCLLLSYWAISLRNLTIVPQVYEDEPWQASTGWKLATEGVFGTDLFAGFYGMERHYYGYMPIHPLFLAGLFRFAGVGLYQDRFEPVAMGLLTLALTYSLGRRLFRDSRIGLLAVLFLIAVRLTGLTPSQVSGILFLDMARISRYDMVVPVFGLASLHVYLFARTRGGARRYTLAGVLVGLAGLTHLYGVFWLPALILLAMWDGPLLTPRLSMSRGSIAGYLLLGFSLPWLPYVAYVLSDVVDWRGQTRGYADRFDPLNPHWYLQNLLDEPQRYGPGLGPIGPAVLLRIGFWSALVGVPLSLAALTWRGWRHGDRAARAIVVPAIVCPVLFAFLIRLKLANYLVTIAPIGAAAAAWGSAAVWRWAGRARGSRWIRPVLAAILLAIVAEGAARVAAFESAASTTTPYPAFIDRVRREIPAGTRVLGLHNYWFGLEDFDYRSFALPLLWMDAQNEPRPLPLDEGLERVAPDVVLIDPRIRQYFVEDARAGGARAARFSDWLSRHNGQLVARIEDATYGLMEIYQVKR